MLQLIRELSHEKLHSSGSLKYSYQRNILEAILLSFHNLLMTEYAVCYGSTFLKVLLTFTCQDTNIINEFTKKYILKVRNSYAFNIYFSVTNLT